MQPMTLLPVLAAQDMHYSSLIMHLSFEIFR
jgi:hypothetical protein